MPIKHQGDSYRTRAGHRYIGDGDILDTAKGDLRTQAKARVAELVSQRRPAFYEKTYGGFRVFVHVGKGE